MEATAACKYSYFGLPKLSTAKHVQRRDSLSSSRTRDSGYNSDPDTLSPLDPIGLDQEFLLAPIPGVPSFFTNSKVTPFKLHGDSYRSRGFGRHNITSDPVGAVAHRAIPHPPELETIPRHTPVKTLAVQQTSQDDDIERWVNDNLPLRSQPEQRSLSIISLSTASSCDMYTSTDISDDEHDHEGGSCTIQQPRSTLKVIELILRRVEISLRHAAYKQCAGNKASGAQTGPYISLDQSSRTTSLSSGSKRKLRQEGTPPPDDDDEGSPNKRRRGSLATTDESETGVRFACPFYKHDPNRYRNRRTCAGPGWPTVHRMKEHLYRSHAQPIFCPICYATFKSDKDQSSHVRLQQCERSSPQQIEGIDRETVWTLRKRTTALRLEEDKWRDVYQTLFPDVPVEDIPSPFYDCDSPSEASRRFRRDLLRRVQEELYSEAAQMPSPVEQQLLQRVAEIVRRCEHDLLNQAHPASTPSFTTDRRASATSSTGSSYQATPAPVLSPEPVQRPSTSALAYQDHRMQGPVSLPDTVQYLPEPTVEFSHVAWDDPSYNAFSLGIDWDDIFPPAPSAQYRSSDEPVAAMSRPMWT